MSSQSASFCRNVVGNKNVFRACSYYMIVVSRDGLASGRNFIICLLESFSAVTETKSIRREI